MPKIYFEVNVIPKYGDGHIKGEERSSFWRGIAIRSRHVDEKEPSPDKMENQLKLNFGIQLRNRLHEHFFNAWGQHREFKNVHMTTEEAEQRKHLSLIFFELKDIKYGSLDFSVEIAGFNHLVKLFDGNFNLLEMFLNAYVPSAFSRSIEYWDLAPAEYQVAIPELMREAFHKVQSLPSGHAITDSFPLADQRVRWIWMITNGSLVVPVVLSLAVLFVAAKLLDQDRISLLARFDAVQKKEDALLQAQSERLQDLEEAFLLPKPADAKSSSTP